MSELADHERVALLTERLGLPAGSLPLPLALEALRHGSYLHERHVGGDGARSNERLEFLGDAVLGFLLARRFYERLPEAPEGESTRLRASMVREESLAIAARELKLGELLLLGRAEQRSGMRENPARLADALEAVLGAVYLSCGMDRAQEVLERVLAPLLQQSVALARDPKTELQERVQAAHRAAPSYRVLDAPGPQHARIFEVEVAFQGVPLGRGSGRTKKEAEQAAARAAIEASAALDAAAPMSAASIAPEPGPFERDAEAVAAVERAAEAAAPSKLP
ncbi:MAG: hypothetical protein NVS4B10_10410 [Myxococcales bacterium]